MEKTPRNETNRQKKTSVGYLPLTYRAQFGLKIMHIERKNDYLEITFSPRDAFFAIFFFKQGRHLKHLAISFI